MDAICNFKRIEKKYLLSEEQYHSLFSAFGDRLRPDEFGRSTVMSLYLDTPDRRIIRSSIEADDYKEKLRIRSYGEGSCGSTVFLELKKKFGGVVYKRRVAMRLDQAEMYLRKKQKPSGGQMMSVIDWSMRFYGWPEPAMMIVCEREAWFDDENPDLRLTFDRNIRAREYDLKFRNAEAGEALLPDDTVLLEIKTAGAMPLWLADALDGERIFPHSFSKYGTAYMRSEIKKHIIPIADGGLKDAVNF